MKQAQRLTYFTVVNHQCEKFRLSELSIDMFKCQFFVEGLMANKDAEIPA